MNSNTYRSFGNAEVRTVSDKDRVLAYTYSDETVDRYGTILKANGWQNLKHWVQNNPAFLFAHKADQPPIGRPLSASNPWQGRKDAMGGEIQYTSEEENPFGYMMYKLAKGGYMRTVSVRFDIPDSSSIWVPTPEEKKVLGLPEHGLVYTKLELLEVSLVPVPGNPNAVEEAYQKGIVTPKEHVWLRNYLAEIEEMTGVRLADVICKPCACDSKEKKSQTACNESRVFDSLHLIEESIRSLTSTVEKLGSGERGPNLPPPGPRPSGDDGEDLYESVLSGLESVGKSLSAAAK